MVRRVIAGSRPARLAAAGALVLGLGGVGVGLPLAHGAGHGTTAQLAAQQSSQPSAQDLLASVIRNGLPSLTGTVSETVQLGQSQQGGSIISSFLLGTLSGSHQVKLWYDGPQQVRVSPVGSDLTVLRSGQDVWVFHTGSNGGSGNQRVLHLVLPDQQQESQPEQTEPSPQQLAQKLLSKLPQGTDARVDGTVTVAGQQAYQLVLTPPQDSQSSISRVTAAVDMNHGGTVLRLRVDTQGQSQPALQLAFDQVSYGSPGQHAFTYSPPDPASVRSLSLPDVSAWPGLAGLWAHVTGVHASTLGHGWDSVVKVTGLPPAWVGGGSQSSANGGSSLPSWLQALSTPVNGSWGSGHLLSTQAFSVLVLDDGTVYAGAVSGQTLQQAVSGQSASTGS